MFGCGGFIGDIDGCLVDNISVKNTMNLKTIKKTVDENAAANGVPRILNYSMTNVGGVIGYVQNSTVQNATLDVTMNLTGGYFNRIGGAFGASWNSTFDQIADSKNGNIHVPIKLNISEYCVGSSECPTEDKLFENININSIKTSIITTPNITFLGGFAGKSANSIYKNIDVSLNLDIDWGSLTCHGNSSDDDKIHLMHYVGNMFGYAANDSKKNEQFDTSPCKENNKPDSTQFKLPDCSQEIIYCPLSPMN